MSILNRGIVTFELLVFSGMWITVYPDISSFLGVPYCLDRRPINGTPDEGKKFFHCLNDENNKSVVVYTAWDWVANGTCAFYNNNANKIDHRLCDPSSGECPTEAYRSPESQIYSGCYKNDTKRKNMDRCNGTLTPETETKCKEFHKQTGWQVAAFILIVFVVILSAITAFFCWKFKDWIRKKLRNHEDDEEQTIQMTEVQSTDEALQSHQATAPCEETDIDNEINGITEETGLLDSGGVAYPPGAPELTLVNAGDNRDNPYREGQMQRDVGMETEVPGENPRVRDGDHHTISHTTLAEARTQGALVKRERANSGRQSQREGNPADHIHGDVQHQRRREDGTDRREMRETFSGKRRNEDDEEDLIHREDHSHDYEVYETFIKAEPIKSIGRITLRTERGDKQYGNGIRVGTKYVLTTYLTMKALILNITNAYFVNLSKHDENKEYLWTKVKDLFSPGAKIDIMFETPFKENKKKEMEGIWNTCNTFDMFREITPNSKGVLEEVTVKHMDSCHIQFKRNAVKHSFTGNIPFISKKDNFVILELASADEIPPGFPLECKSDEEDNFVHVIGYQWREESLFFPKCSIIKDSEDLNKLKETSKEYFLRKFELDVSTRLSNCKLEDGKILLNRSSLTIRGMTGAPCFVLHGKTPKVKAMLNRGHPTLYREKNIGYILKNLDFTALIEEGITMTRVVEVLSSTRDRSIESLKDDLLSLQDYN